MSSEVTAHRMPWDAAPVAETLALLQRDFAYAVTHTCIAVRSSRPELQIMVNIVRGQTVPSGPGVFSDGTTIEFSDIGMPQPCCREMSINELVAHVTQAARQLGLGFK